MNRRVLVASFAREEDLLGAVRSVRAAGQEVVDAYTPYPVHGLPEAMGLRPSRLPWVCLGFGLLGFAGGLLLQVWTSAFDWPLNVGGKPLLSLPAFVPVAFELVVLFAGLGTVAAFLFRTNLKPYAVPKPVAPGITDDRFVLVVGARGAAYDGDDLARRLADRHGACAVEERLVEDGR